MTENIEIRDRIAKKFANGWPRFVDVGDGWLSIVDELDKQLEALGIEYSYAQIKQKFGGIRIYVNTLDPRANSLIRIAEEKALVTCEICGKPGRLTTKNFYVQTVCKEHE
jgi:hypothetical protein